MRILIQFPEGLKDRALEEAAKLERKGHTVFVSASACYGACDLCLEEAREVKADRIIHFGHSKFMEIRGRIGIEYVPCFFELDWKRAAAAIEKGVALLKRQKVRTVAVVFPLQHLKNARRLLAILKKEGLCVKIGRGGRRLQQAGQVLGCDASAADVKGAEAIVYFGGGKFHPTGISADKKVLCINPHANDAYWLTDEMRMAQRRRNGSILAASQAKTFGILVSTKCGQKNLPGALMAKRMLEGRGRRAAILVANELNPASISNFASFDAYINTACPRIADDVEAYGKPIVNVADIKRLLELIDATGR
ncbi:MAG: diphthamide biosynthesis enzyme Dph2 [Candidatus Micrarchaeota archaeon]|nr:diphthamide biosynthesis enzyme Dph2 [Candidatus Micrarchaeota archaeon]